MDGYSRGNRAGINGRGALANDVILILEKVNDLFPVRFGYPVLNGLKRC